MCTLIEGDLEGVEDGGARGGEVMVGPRGTVGLATAGCVAAQYKFKYSAI